MTPDVERLLSAWMRTLPGVTAIAGDRVFTEIPSRPAFPLVRLTQIGGAPVWSHPLWLDTADIQVDCYGGPKAQARALMDTIRTALDSELVGVHDGGVVTDVQFGPARYLPDTDLDPPKPRWIFQCTILSHPVKEAINGH